MRAKEFLGTGPRRPTREGQRPSRGHDPVLRYRAKSKDLSEFAPSGGRDGSNDDMPTVILNYINTNHPELFQQFGQSTVEEVVYDRDAMGYYRPEETKNKDLEDLVSDIEDVLYNEYDNEQQLDELMFMGMSPCTKDCSGHRAGYRWSKARGGVSTASQSNSFNKGAEIAKAGY